MDSKQLQFVVLSSSINPSFWNKFYEIKLNVDKLNVKEHRIWGYFSNINSNQLSLLEVNSTSFNERFDSGQFCIPFQGSILNTNTVEQFKEYDKNSLINKVGDEILKHIETGEALHDPSLLNKFFILSFADLKKYQFYYWFAFPIPVNLSVNYIKNQSAEEIFNEMELSVIWEMFCDLDVCQRPYFLIKKDEVGLLVSKLSSGLKCITEDNYTEHYFAFSDTSFVDDSPGSMLRNFITLVLYYCPFLSGKQLKFLSLRLNRNDDLEILINDSRLFTLEIPEVGQSISDLLFQNDQKSWVGWEKNERGKLGPRLSNMKSFLDPKELAENSVDLNLKLMKWRILSNLNLEKIKESKYLLLGSGTLGCSVARILLGWGARYITFVDNSTVSYSNPVRQSLFSFEDSKNSKLKSLAAADNLRLIFPGVQTKSYQFTIPMPGHPVGKSLENEVKSDVEILERIIKENDIIFLLMDSRESRWLPTLLGSYHCKIVINAALGFDSYLVMRHGVRVDMDEFKIRQYSSGFKSLKGNDLGCYFCNDVAAPGNSLKDRTLDQQCTVTRPGVSAIAGALAAEMAVSILHHKEGPKAPAFYDIGNCKNPEEEIDFQSVLGLLPHCIRGNLFTFGQVLPATQRFDKCTACSEFVLNEYGSKGFDFLFQVFEDSYYLEEITGLAVLTKEAMDIGVLDFSDEEEIAITNYEQSEQDVSHEVAKSSTNITEKLIAGSDEIQNPLKSNKSSSIKSVYADTLDEISQNKEVTQNTASETIAISSAMSSNSKENLKSIPVSLNTTKSENPFPFRTNPENPTILTVLKNKVDLFSSVENFDSSKSIESMKNIQKMFSENTTNSMVLTLMSKHEINSSIETIDEKVTKSAQEIVDVLPHNILTILANTFSSESSRSLDLKNDLLTEEVNANSKHFKNKLIQLNKLLEDDSLVSISKETTVEDSIESNSSICESDSHYSSLSLKNMSSKIADVISNNNENEVAVKRNHEVSVLEKPRDMFTSSLCFDKSKILNCGFSDLIKEIDDLSNVLAHGSKDSSLNFKNQKSDLYSTNIKNKNNFPSCQNNMDKKFNKIDVNNEQKEIMNLISVKNLFSSDSLSLNASNLIMSEPKHKSGSMFHILNERKLTSSKQMGLESEIKMNIRNSVNSEEKTETSSNMLTSDDMISSSDTLSLEDEDEESEFFLAETDSDD